MVMIFLVFQANLPLKSQELPNTYELSNAKNKVDGFNIERFFTSSEFLCRILM